MLALLAAGDARALLRDQVMLIASEQIAYDDNVYRLSANAIPGVVIGRSYLGDWWHMTTLGISFDVPAGRQRFQAAYNQNNQRYQHFTDRNFDGYDEHATWLWQLGNEWSGQVGGTETRALASLTSYFTLVPNPITTRQVFANATHLGASSRFQVGVGGLTQRNGNPTFMTQDFDSTSADVSGSRLTAAGDSLGLSGHVENGRFPNRVVVPGSTVDSAYTQANIEVFTDWTPSGRSHLNARAGVVGRRYAQLTQSNYTGGTYHVTYDFKPTGKFALTLLVFREITPNEDIRTNFILGQGVSLRPTWSLGAKTDLSGTFAYVRQDYLGNPGFLPDAAPQQVEHISDAGLSLVNRFTRNGSLTFAVQHEVRTSSIPLRDYRDNTFSVTVRLAF
jgi:hypothetical protein